MLKFMLEDYSDTLYEENYITYYIDSNDYETDYESYIVKDIDSDELKAQVKRIKNDIDAKVEVGAFPGLYVHEIIIRGSFVEGRQTDVDEFIEDELRIDTIDVYDEHISTIDELQEYSPEVNWSVGDTQEWLDDCNRAYEAKKKDR